MNKNNQLSLMKFIFALLILSFADLHASAQAEKINWLTDYTQALAESRETGKPVLIDFSAKWCAPCREMDEKFWTREDVAKAVKSFVPLKIDYDAQRDIAKLFVVRGLPYVAFSDPYGGLVTYHRGYLPFTAEDIKSIREKMPKDFKSLEDAYKALESDAANGAALLKIADYYAQNQMPVAAARFYQRGTLASDFRSSPENREHINFELGRQYYAADDFYQAAFAFQDYLKLYPAGKNRETVYAALISVCTKIKRLDDAAALLVKLKTEYPSSKLIADAEREIEQAKKMQEKKS